MKKPNDHIGSTYLWSWFLTLPTEHCWPILNLSLIHLLMSAFPPLFPSFFPHLSAVRDTDPRQPGYNNILFLFISSVHPSLLFCNYIFFIFSGPSKIRIDRRYYLYFEIITSATPTLPLWSDPIVSRSILVRDAARFGIFSGIFFFFFFLHQMWRAVKKIMRLIEK